MTTPELCAKAGELNLVIEQGATFDPVFTWKDQNGLPINLTGFTARMQIRETVDSVAVLHELTTENGGLTLGGSAGTITVQISATDTAAFDFEQAVYDLEVEAANGGVTRLLRGFATLSKEVTR